MLLRNTEGRDIPRRCCAQLKKTERSKKVIGAGFQVPAFPGIDVIRSSLTIKLSFNTQTRIMNLCFSFGHSSIAQLTVSQDRTQVALVNNQVL